MRGAAAAAVVVVVVVVNLARWGIYCVSRSASWLCLWCNVGCIRLFCAECANTAVRT